jgi:hypothetical protein
MYAQWINGVGTMVSIEINLGRAKLPPKDKKTSDEIL